MNKVPGPQECGLPSKFDRWRSGQEDMISRIVELPQTGKRCLVACAPTGSGKSPAYVAGAILSGLPTCVVTDSRALQDQVMTDFASIGMVDIRGRRNYECTLRPDYTCEDGFNAQCSYKGSVGCPASLAEIKASTSPLVVTNYDKWTAARKYGTGMQHFQQVIFDEGHEMPEALSRALQVVLNHKEIEETLRVPFLTGEEGLEFANWKPWAVHTRGVCDGQLNEIKRKVLGISNPKPSHVKHFTHLRNLYRRLSLLALANPKDWVVDEREQGFQFDPIRPGKYAETTLLLKVPRIIVMSATIRPKTMYMCGIGDAAMNFVEYPSDFDPKRCPIYYVPTMRVDKWATDLSPLWLRHDQIAARRRDRKGLTQTVSYARQEEVLAASRFADSMIINQKGEAPGEILKQYRDSGPGTILVSPSFGQGSDFPGTQCEWQFICKIPFDPPSKILKAREALDKDYRSYRAMNKLVQFCGRHVRSKEDRGECFIGDDHMKWFWDTNKYLAPKWFHGFFQRRDILPAPPPKL